MYLLMHGRPCITLQLTFEPKRLVLDGNTEARATTLKNFKVLCSGILRQALSFSHTETAIVLSRYVAGTRSSTKANHAVQYVLQHISEFALQDAHAGTGPSFLQLLSSIQFHSGEALGSRLNAPEAAVCSQLAVSSCYRCDRGRSMLCT